jgi:hypothetical protein
VPEVVEVEPVGTAAAAVFLAEDSLAAAGCLEVEVPAVVGKAL